MHHPTYRITHTTAFVTPVVEHWLEREIAQWVHPMKDRSDHPSHHERTLLPRSYISLPTVIEETRCRHSMSYSFRVAARVILYSPSHRQDSTYYGLYYTSRGSPAGRTKNHIEGSIRRPMSGCSTTKLHPTQVTTAVVPEFKTVEIRKKEKMFYLTTHTTHFIYGYMAMDIW